MSDVIGGVKQVGDVVASWWPVLTGGGSIAVCKYIVLPGYRRVRSGLRRVDEALKQVDKMAAAFGENGGSTLADMIRRTNHHSRHMSARLVALEDFIAVPLFEADRAGTFTRVNKALEMLSGFSMAELVGRGWINLVRPEERTRVVDEWTHAIEDCRACDITMRIETRHHKAVMVQLVAHPVVDDITDELFSWRGQMLVLSAEGCK